MYIIFQPQTVSDFLTKKLTKLRDATSFTGKPWFQLPVAFLIMTLSTTYLAIVLPFILFYGAVLIYSVGQAQGNHSVEEEIELYETKGCYFKEGKRWNNCNQLIASDGKTVVQEGILIAQADKRVAFYNGKHSVILEIPEGASIRNVVNAKLLKLESHTK